MTLALSACASPPPLTAPAMVAGWDFSWYLGDGLLSVDGATFTDTLAANYSDLDPTYGAGAESAAFGTMYLDGRFGATDTPLDYADPLLPSAAAPGSLLSHRGAPAGVDFDCFSVLKKEGQLFANPLSMTVLGPSRVVFEADLGSVPELGSNWSLRFAGKASAGRLPVGIELSTDGADCTLFGSVDLTDADTPFHVKLGSTRSRSAFVRLSFEPDPAAPQQGFETGATALAVAEPCPRA